MLSALSQPKVRYRTVIALSYTLGGFVLLLIQTVLAGDERLRFYRVGAMTLPTFIGLTGALALFFGLGGFIFAYLRGDYGQLGALKVDTNEVSDEVVMAVEKLLRDAKGGTAGSQVRDRDDNDKDRVVESQAVHPTLTSPEDEITITFRQTRGRLREEIQNLSRRSSLNLVIGVMVTMAATGVLVYLVSREHGDFASITSLLSFYIPRITTVILIETFAYFFLRLYRQNLEELKYYQNELTTIAAQEIAWKAAVIAATDEAKNAVIQQLAKSDRNSRPLVDSSGSSKTELSSLVEVLQTVSKLIVSSAKAKE